MLSEYLSEITAASQAACLADQGDGFPALGQHTAGLLQTVSLKIFHRSGAQTFLKGAETFPFADKGSTSNIPNCNLIPKMFMDVYDHHFQLVIVFCAVSIFIKERGADGKNPAPDIREGIPQPDLISIFLRGDLKRPADGFQNGSLLGPAGIQGNNAYVCGCCERKDIFFFNPASGSPSYERWVEQMLQLNRMDDPFGGLSHMEDV